MFCDDCNRNPDCHAVWKTHGDRATNCVCWTPKKTNADRIRNMTDEELAELISSDWCEIVCTPETNCQYADCRGKILGWLRQEVQDADINKDR